MPASACEAPFCIRSKRVVVRHACVCAACACRVVSKPLLQPAFCLPTATAIDGTLLLGGVLFGAGWGMSGLCPGPALVSLAVLTPQLAAYLAALLVGMALHMHVWATGGASSGAQKAQTACKAD